jgi:uncharacterized RDD family membrane protein YckC
MENSYSVNQTQPDLLDDYGVNLTRASAGQRFGNFIIDIIVYYGLFIGLGVVFSQILVVLATPLVNLVSLGLYFSLVELIFGGRTLGKMITGTRAVQEDGSPITASQAFARGFSRVVPFEAFSALGSGTYPWHDRWSHTYVIDIKESTLPEATV